MSKLEQTLCQLLEKGESVVLATILSQVGSTPRTAGTKMLICSDGKSIGTIGGGLVEAEVIKAGAEIFETTYAQVRTFDLTVAGTADSIDAICGGRLKVLIERIEANPTNLQIFQSLLTSLKKGKKSLLVAALEEEGKPLKQVSRCLIMDDGSLQGDFVLPASLSETLMKKYLRERMPVVLTLGNRRFLVEPTFVPGTVYIFGAGHVSQKLAVLTRMIDFRTVVLDDREEFANRERFRDADEVKVFTDFEEAFSDLEIDHDSYVVIVTRGHRHDKTVLVNSLGTKAGYIGMIGSKRKRAAVYRALLDQGFTSQDLNRVHSPIGLSIDAETPEEIAVSIAAELIAARAAAKQ